jgi:hypothetical protein
MLKPVGSLLPDALSRLRVRKPVEASLVCRACDEAIGTLWDHAVPMRTVSFRGGIATVAVTGPAWGHEILTKSETIKETVNKKLAGSPVKTIKTRVAPSVARGEVQ